MNSAPLTPRALSLISDRSSSAPVLQSYAIISTTGIELCRVNAVDPHAAVGLALAQRDLRFYLRSDLAALEVK